MQLITKGHHVLDRVETIPFFTAHAAARHGYIASDPALKRLFKAPKGTYNIIRLSPRNSQVDSARANDPMTPIIESFDLSQRILRCV
ncbi:hypothetical protein BofuT4_P019660.1 [Botrytis cinerea T4]|uniref:Uncharacterized protein n=1 Tax=Botryotinia fuckeliana (strain T4) TaxID=999810 RepID=G2YIX3_BOTF4|nr:hypothetical protein BofuT4_P019660.1 [Botrytis cinerea T4]